MYTRIAIKPNLLFLFLNTFLSLLFIFLLVSAYIT